MCGGDRIRVPLVRQTIGDDELQTHSDVVITGRGDLMLEGFHAGSLVEALWGDSDYEFSIRVKARDKRKVLDRLVFELSRRGDFIYEDERLVSLIRERFGKTKDTETTFEAWLRLHDIPFELSSY